MPFDLTSAVHVQGHSFYVIAQERHGVLNEASDMGGYEKELPENLRKGSICYIHWKYIATNKEKSLHYLSSLNIFFIIEFPIGNAIKMEKIKALNEAGNITRNLINPPLKDTISVPDAGFSLIRFVADNPGFWMIHSTSTWFHYMGMEVVLQVRI